MEKLPSERRSGAVRVLGVGDEEDNLLRFFEAKFQQDLGLERDAFLEKPEELRKLIPDINKNLQQFLSQYEATPLEIGEHNIKIVDVEKLTEAEKDVFLTRGTKGFYSSTHQLIAMLEEYKEGGKLLFLQHMVHEMIHLISFQSFQKTNEKNAQITLVDEESGEDLFLSNRRVGLNIISSDGRLLLKNLNEAVTTELEIRFDKNYFSKIPEIGEITEYKEREHTIKKLLEENSITEEDVKNTAYCRFNGDEINLEQYPYKKEREEMWNLIDRLYNNHKENYTNKEEVFELFAKGSMNGELLPLFRLLHKEFGPGIFKSIREEDEKEN